jgi:outer membrane protein assembly factor BamB
MGRTTQRRFTSPLHGPGLGAAVVWSFNVQNPVYESAVVAADGTIFIGATAYNESTGGLFALSPTGSPLWAFNLSEVDCTPALGGSPLTVYFGGLDANFYALDAET